ncbi:hypothetical protein KFU94_57305 [Chloroflexi bacterium TSY]|nr:hypothetical protein [Chloroflexi bacterium TSY]
MWPEEVANYLLTDDEANDQEGYSIIERQIGAAQTTDFIRGSYRHFGAKVQAVHTQVPSLTQVGEAPSLFRAIHLWAIQYRQIQQPPILPMQFVATLEASGGQDRYRRLLVPNAQVLKLETENSLVHQIVLACRGRQNDGRSCRDQTTEFETGAMVVLAMNTIHSTRRHSPFRRTDRSQELMGRNWIHVRGNYVWQVKKDALAPNNPGELANEMHTAALHIEGKTGVLDNAKTGRFHLQFYGANSDGSGDPERVLYRMLPDQDEVDKIVASQSSDAVVLEFAPGETFGDRETPLRPATIPFNAAAWTSTPLVGLVMISTTKMAANFECPRRL